MRRPWSGCCATTMAASSASGCSPAHGSEVPIRAGLTIGADGIGSLVAREVDARLDEPWQRSQRHPLPLFPDVPSEGYVWGYGDGAAAGLIPTNAGETCVFVATAPERMRRLRRDGAEAAFDRLLDAVPAPLSDVVRAGGPGGQLRGWGGVPGYVRRSFGAGWALVGDAGYFKDPITTHGLTDALRDAELLSDAVLADVGGASPGDAAMATYQRTRDGLSKALVDVTESVSRYDWDDDADPHAAARA